MKQQMVQNLFKPGIKKKEKDRKRRLKALIDMNDDVREHSLQVYYHYCKEKAAKSFLEWRIWQAEIVCDPERKKLLRFRRLVNFMKYDKEQHLFRLYMIYEDNFEDIRPQLMQMELEIQAERDVPIWGSMHQLIIDSNAASIYVQAFLDRKASKEFDKDLCDGTQEEIQPKILIRRQTTNLRPEIPVNNSQKAITGVAEKEVNKLDKFTTPKHLSHLPTSMNADIEKFAFLTPLDFVKDRTQAILADQIEEDFN